MLTIEDYLIMLRLGADFKNPKERGGVGGGKQERQSPEDRRKDRNYYRQNKSKLRRKSDKYYHRVCKKNRKCMQRREEYKEDPKRYKRKKKGTIILYDQEAPNKEVQQPEDNVSYRGVSPTHFTHSPDEKEGLPKGNDLPDRHLDDVPPATSRVVPNGQYVTSSFNKRGTTISTLLSKTGNEIISNSSSVSLTPFRFMPKKGFWSFKAEGSKETYTVKIKGLGMAEGNIKSLSKAPIKVSCTCPFFRWQGPEYHAKKGGYLFGKLSGSASKPLVKDPNENKVICKHLAAAFKTAQGYKAASIFSSSRVASLYTRKLNRIR